MKYSISLLVMLVSLFAIGQEDPKLTLSYEPIDYSTIQTKKDTISVNCLCLVDGELRIVGKNQERFLFDRDVIVSSYPLIYEKKWISSQLRWLDKVDDCYIIAPAKSVIIE